MFPQCEANFRWFFGECKGKWGFVKFLGNEPQMNADEHGWGEKNIGQGDPVPTEKTSLTERCQEANRAVHGG